MKKKSTSMKPSRPAMSPLLRSLTYSRASREPMIDGMLLQCYAALDAFDRGHGSQTLFMTLCRHLLVAEELCQLGHAADCADAITVAHEALVAVDTRHSTEGAWILDADAHAQLCTALALFGQQLEEATLEHIAQAEARMVTQSLLAASMRSGVRRAQPA
ncbi:hypothetical protein [Caballeronia sp. LZ034LL]|uniref:hypothetical protein n=1 Tax=Caballeronia sp. LZ034LL TaxID=3038567 RepID=UPI003857DCAD